MTREDFYRVSKNFDGTPVVSVCYVNLTTDNAEFYVGKTIFWTAYGYNGPLFGCDKIVGIDWTRRHPLTTIHGGGSNLQYAFLDQYNPDDHFLYIEDEGQDIRIIAVYDGGEG